jgi:hypothetical protein
MIFGLSTSGTCLSSSRDFTHLIIPKIKRTRKKTPKGMKAKAHKLSPYSASKSHAYFSENSNSFSGWLVEKR